MSTNFDRWLNQYNKPLTQSREGCDRFTMAYIVAALWSSTNDEGEPLDRDYDITDFHPESLERIRIECFDFQQRHLATVEDPEPGHG